ncbi:MAG: response regulator transcription factor [Candidatus Methylomirabilis oxyfera]|nr:response regulator transcription factor [Candidatus Methylomirabilis oxyfera]
MLRVLIVDDHAVVRQGLKQIVGAEPDMRVTGEAANANELLALARHEPYDVVVLDLHMPGISGLDALKELKHDCPQLPVLVLSMHPEDQVAVRTLKLGASGYLTKESAPEELVKAIRKVVSGGRYVSPTLAERLANDVAIATDRPLHEGLSSREYQVLSLIGAGKRVNDIATQLNLSVKTVSTYRARILEKLQMSRTADLIAYAIRNKLVD